MLQHPHLVHPRQRHLTAQQTSHQQISHSTGMQLPKPVQSSHFQNQEQTFHASQYHQQSSSSGDMVIH